MERIIRLNAVEILCRTGIVGMNEHSLHPDEHLAPQKPTISGVSFASLIIEAPANTANRKLGNSLLAFKTGFGNTLVLPALLQGLLSKVLEAFSCLVFGGNIPFVMIFAIERKTRKIEQVTPLLKEARLWEAKAPKLILLEVILRKQIKVRDKKAYYNKPAVSLTNLTYPLLCILNKEDEIIQLALNRNRDCEFMYGKVVSTYKDTQIKEKLAQACRIELLLEGKK